MPDLTAKRTLVKSPPELWEELSEVERLAKHLGAFGEITITKLEPEHTVAWEGEHASGTVSIEPSGWGTKVTLRAELPEPSETEAEPEPEPAETEPEPAETAPEPAEPEPVPVPEPAPEPEPEPAAAAPAEEGQHVAGPAVPRRGFWGWLFRRRTETVVAEPEPEPVVAEPEPARLAEETAEPEPVAEEPAEPEPVAEEPAEPEPAVEAPVAAEPALEAAAEPALEAAADPAVDAALDPERARVILDEALDTLGAAHHRPFSRG